jgi:hypothetical protein
MHLIIVVQYFPKLIVIMLLVLRWIFCASLSSNNVQETFCDVFCCFFSDSGNKLEWWMPLESRATTRSLCNWQTTRGSLHSSNQLIYFFYSILFICSFFVSIFFIFTTNQRDWSFFTRSMTLEMCETKSWDCCQHAPTYFSLDFFYVTFLDSLWFWWCEFCRV